MIESTKLVKNLGNNDILERCLSWTLDKQIRIAFKYSCKMYDEMLRKIKIVNTVKILIEGFLNPYYYDCYYVYFHEPTSYIAVYHVDQLISEPIIEPDDFEDPTNNFELTVLPVEIFYDRCISAMLDNHLMTKMYNVVAESYIEWYDANFEK
ncbi:MAG: hypothetical protein ACRCZI_01095 [Cetobacterium sp.]